MSFLWTMASPFSKKHLLKRSAHPNKKSGYISSHLPATPLSFHRLEAPQCHGEKPLKRTARPQEGFLKRKANIFQPRPWSLEFVQETNTSLRCQQIGTGQGQCHSSPRQHKPTGLHTSPSSWALLSLTDAFNITTGVDPLTLIDGIVFSLCCSLGGFWRKLPCQVGYLPKTNKDV